MATVNKDFKIKNGLIVEGSTATVNGNPVLTETASDQYIIDLIGGETLITSVDPTDFKVSVGGELQIDSLSTLARTSDIPTSTDDLSEGATNKYYVKGTAESDIGAFLANASKTNINITYDPVSGLEITAENGVADSTTDNLTEGTSNLYFTEQRARDAFSAGAGIAAITNGVIEVNLSTGLEFRDGTSGGVRIDRDETDTWYDAAGTAANAIADHASDTSTHGVTGAIVGTTDTQTLSNKSFAGTTLFYDPTDSIIGTISESSGDFAIGAENNLSLYSSVGDIIVSPAVGQHAYIDGATAGNEIATHSYVDNAVSGLAWKPAVNVLANANVSLTGFTSPMPFEIDGHTVSDGYRVLLTAQSTNSENGIYDAAVSGGTYTLTRSADADAYTELIGAAVYVMEGTTYGSTSWVQGDHYITDFSGQDWTQFSGQGSVTAGTGITVDGLEVSVDRTTVDTWYEPAGAIDALTTKDVAEDQDYLYFTGQRAVDAALGNAGGSTLSTYLTNYNSGGTPYVDVNTTALDARYDAAGAASTAETNANTYTDNQLEAYTPSSSLEATIDGYGFAYTSEIPTSTDEISEGQLNLYFTDGRAVDAVKNGMLGNALAGYTKVELMPGSNALAIITPGTDEILEGSTNLYFTDSRAQSAVDGTTRSFTAININDYRKEEATQQYVASTSTVTAHSFSYPYGSAKYLVRVVGSVAGVMHTQVTELLATIDGNNNVAVTEYGTIHTSESALATATVEYSGGTFNLRVTTLVGGAEVIAAVTLLSWAD